MNKSTLFALAIALTTGVVAALAQTGSAPRGPPDGQSAPGTTMPLTSVVPDALSTRAAATSTARLAVTPTPLQTLPQRPIAPDPPSITNNPPVAIVPSNRVPVGEPQARAKIEDDGYKNVGPLTRGVDGVWQGTAMRGATSVGVIVDARGNVLLR